MANNWFKSESCEPLGNLSELTQKKMAEKRVLILGYMVTCLPLEENNVTLNPHFH